MEDVDKDASVMEVPEGRRDIYGNKKHSIGDINRHRKLKQKTWKEPSKQLLDQNSTESVKLNFNKTKRYQVDFNNELTCLQLHYEQHKRSELQQLVKEIYIHKWNVKKFSPYLYAGEKTPEYFN